MGKRTGPTNIYLKNLIDDLRKRSFESKVPIWKDVADKLNNPTRKKVEVNIADIERNTEKNDVVIVPGIVLSDGELSKPLTIAARKFSSKAREKIEKSKGKILTIEGLVQDKPKGTGVKILV